MKFREESIFDHPRVPKVVPGQNKQIGWVNMCFFICQNHVFKGVWDDLDAGIGISIKKIVLDMGSNYFFDGLEIFGIFTPMCLFLRF